MQAGSSAPERYFRSINLLSSTLHAMRTAGDAFHSLTIATATTSLQNGCSASEIFYSNVKESRRSNNFVSSTSLLRNCNKSKPTWPNNNGEVNFDGLDVRDKQINHGIREDSLAGEVIPQHASFILGLFKVLRPEPQLDSP